MLQMLTIFSFSDANYESSGAQIVFRSFVQPVFAKYFSGAGAASANLRSKLDSDKVL